MKKQQLIIGRKDRADLPRFGLAGVQVKIDSGAYTSTIQCTKVEEADGRLEVVFLDKKDESFTGEKGTFIVANTAGFHRKGIHKSNKPRITLACGVKRKGLIAKLLINLLALLKNDKP